MAEKKQLEQARAAALELLARDAEASELRDAARGLGTALVETAHDEDLWARLGESVRANALTDEQRLELRTALSVDWPSLLEEVGYQPPPPPGVYGMEFVEAIRLAYEGKEPANLGAVREKLLVLGQTLVELSGEETVAPSRLRRWLRRGVRVAGKVLVVVGVAAAGFAVVHAMPAVAVLSPFLKEVGVDVLKEGTTRVLDWTLDRVLPEDGEQAEAVDPSDREVLDYLQDVREGELGRLLAFWDPELPGLTRSASLVDETRSFVDHAIRALFLAWDAAVGAPWYGDVAAPFDTLGNDLQRLREELTADQPDAAVVRETLRRVQDVLGGAKRQLGTAIDPHR